MLRLSSNEGNSGMRRRAICVTVGLALAGCGGISEAELDRRVLACMAAIPATKGNYVARARCYETQVLAWRPSNPYFQTLARGKIAIAQRLDRGDVTLEEADFQLSKLWLDVRSQAIQDETAGNLNARLLFGR